MIVCKTDNKFKEQVLDFVDPRADIHHELKDGYSFFGYFENEEIRGGVIFSHYD